MTIVTGIGWLRLPYSYGLMGVHCSGYVVSYDYYDNYTGVRPVVSLASGVQIVEREHADNIYDLAE